MATEPLPGSEPLSMEDAVKSFADPEEEAPETDNQPLEGESDDPVGEETDDTEEEGDAPEDPDDGSDDAYDGGRFAADNAKVKLSDGTVTTIAELKKGNLFHGDWTRKSMEVAETKKQVEATKAEVQSFAAKLQQEREAVATFAQYMLPKRPDPKMIEEGDIIGFNLANEAYSRQMEKLGELNAQYQAYQQQQQAEAEKAAKETKKQEWERLKERAPDLANPEKYQKFWGEALKAGEHYGFTPEELNGLVDHRQYLVLKDALAYRRIKANGGQKPNPQTQQKPPVINGDRRRSAGEAQARQAKAAMAKLDETGSIRDGVAALLALEKR